MEQLATALADRYHLERELGAGGMATVYLAEDLKHHRKVAIKVLREELRASLGPDRFLREINIAAALTHPHILPLHDSGEAAGRLFYVMPFVDGATLRHRLERGGELPIGEAIRVLRDVADAMAYAHSHGVVHRDIKPENVMLSGRHALVTDFGVAKAVSEATGVNQLTTVGVALGTPTYMAPEQATADPYVDHRADIYAFGVLGYELLAGRPPFTGTSPQEVLAAHLTRAPEPLSAHRAAVPVALATLVMKCLEKRPADRWQSAEDLVTALEQLQTPSGGTHPAVVTARGGRRRTRRVALGMACAVIVLAAGAAAARPLRRWLVATPVKERIAVLPLENRTGDPRQDQLGVVAADWVTRGLVDARLTEVVPSAVVIQAVSDARARKEDVVRAVSAVTGATQLVTGAFYSVGDSLRFEAEFVNAATKTSIAGIRPSLAPAAGTMVAIDSLRHRVMGAVAQLAGVLDQFRGSSAPPPSLEAYQLVLRAEEGFVARRYSDMERYYRQSFALDTTYVLAGAGLANALFLLGRLAEADTILQRVERVPPTAPGDVFIVKLFRAYLDGNRETAYELYRSESALLGGGSLRTSFALEAIYTARPREALRILDQVNWRSPDVARSPVWWSLRADALRLLGEDERALREIRRSRQIFQKEASLMRREAGILVALGRTTEIDRLKHEANAAPGYGAFLIEVATEQLLRGDTASGQATALEAIGWFLSQPASDSARYAGGLFWARILAARYSELGLDVRHECDSVSIDCWSGRGIAAALRGDTATARAAGLAIQRITVTPRLRQAPVSMVLAGISAAMGDEDRAIAYIRDALSKGMEWGYPVRQAVAPFPRLRTHAAFRELMRPKG